jgi:energy-converting hydrogenase Eha subunit C
MTTTHPVIKTIIFYLILGGLICLMAEAEEWNFFLASKVMGILAIATAVALIMREKREGRRI